MVDLQRLVDIGLSPDRETLTRRVVAVAESMGFGLASGVLIRGRFGSSSALVESFGNPPEAFKEMSKSLDKGLRDPLMTSLLATPGHMAYGEALYVDSGATDLWDCQSTFGYRHGLSLSIHSQTHAEAFLFGLDRSEALPDGAELLRLRAALQLLSLHAKVALERQLHGTPVQCDELTTRETEVLQKVTATVYGRRGNLSSVSTSSSPELRIAMSKLRAQSVVAAVVHAVGSGLVER